MKHWMLFAMLTLCGTVTTWAQDVSYIERTWNETNKEVVSTTKTLASGTYNAVNGNEPEGWPELTTGWWVVTANSTYKTLAITGDVHLIIPDDVTLTLTGGVKLESDAQTSNKLTIYGQNYNSGTLTVTNSYSGAAGIGGGEGKSCGTLEIHGGTINATGGDKGAGIGGGKNQGFYGGLTIYGGKVNAHGGRYGAGIGSGDENPSNMAGYIAIYGGKVMVNGGEFAAAIGGGDKGNGASLSIYGGWVEAYAPKSDKGDGAGIGGGRFANGVETKIYGGVVYAGGGKYGAGIGGGCGVNRSDKGNSGLIEIHGGTVTAGATVAAAIGCGYSGESATVKISGGSVEATCSSSKSAGIGGGGEYNAKLDITISGGTVEAKGGVQGIGPGKNVLEYDYDGTLVISGGKVYATGSYRAIGGADASGFTLYNEAQVKAGATSGEAVLFSAAERVPACLWRKYAAIEPCDHSDATYTVSGTSTNDTHLKHCAHCTTAFEAETHTFENGKCTVCGVEGTAYTVTIYLPKNNGSTDGVYEATTYQMATGTEFNLPGSPTTPEYLEFAGWLVGDPTGLNSYLTDGETLLPEGQAYTISGDVSFTARYRYLNISLSDNADNGEKLMKYNGMTAPKVILAGRTLYKDGSWNTLCLPFDIHNYKDNQPLKGATVMTLESASFNEENGTLTLYFTDAGNGIKAGKPYIVKWIGTENAELQNPEFSYVTISNTTTDIVTDVVTFKGIFSTYEIEGEDNTLLYMGAGNKLYYPNAAMTIGACRAYFKLADGLVCGEPKTAGADGINQFVLNFGEGESTGISLVDVDLKSTSQESGISNPLQRAWYDMQGRRLIGKPTQKGVYINNGRKIIIK